MEPIFTDKQLNNMSREDLISLMKIVQEQTKKKDTEIQLLKEKQKELEFLNAMLSDRLTLAQRKQFGASSEKYAEGYEQMNLFNEAEASADAETEELFEEIRPSSYKRKKRKGKKEEDLSNFETVETRTYKLEGEARYCPECGKKYNVVTKEIVKRLRFVPAKFAVEEETTLNGTRYLLVSEGEESGDCEAYILKEVSTKDEEVLYQMVEDDVEFSAIAKVFSELTDDDTALEY